MQPNDDSDLANNWHEPDFAPPEEDPDDSEFDEIDPDDPRWDALIPDDDERDPEPEYGDFWTAS